MKIRELTMDEVEFEITAEQDYTEVRGNAMDSGDDEYDKEVEDEINRRLDNGDVWAWAFVKVTAKWHGHEGYDTLGNCNYADEEDFKAPGGYYEDMKVEALADLNRNLQDYADELDELAI